MIHHAEKIKGYGEGLLSESNTQLKRELQEMGSVIKDISMNKPVAEMDDDEDVADKEALRTIAEFTALKVSELYDLDDKKDVANKMFDLFKEMLRNRTVMARASMNAITRGQSVTRKVKRAL